MTNKIKFKTAYDPHPRQHPELDPKSLTHQSMAPECDINTIMRKYEKTGVLEHRNNFHGQYGDFADVPADYQESMNHVLAADEMFQTLPARIRRRFHNDPGAFIAYATDPSNQDELIAMGLAKRRSEAEVVEKATPAPKPKPSASKPPLSDPETPPEGD